jgi:hypothetical protein
MGPSRSPGRRASKPGIEWTTRGTKVRLVEDIRLDAVPILFDLHTLLDPHHVCGVLYVCGV